MPTATSAELLVRLPHLTVIDRLPATLAAGGVTVEATGAVTQARVVGDLTAHVAELRWRRGRHAGAGCWQVVRGGEERTLLTVVLDGDAGPGRQDAAHALVDAVRRLLVAPTTSTEAASNRIDRRRAMASSPAA